MKVAIQGYQGSFHHIVAVKLWGKDVELLERPTFTQIFNDLEEGTTEVGLVAIENTITGSIAETLDLLSSRSVEVIGEIILQVEQNLIVIPGTKIEELKNVFSHPVALLQCLDFFKKYPQIHLIATDDTGGSVKQMMKDGDKSKGSIASDLAAELYGAEILARHIQSDSHNFTRFLVIVNKKTNKEKILKQTPMLLPKKEDSSVKSTLILHMQHKPGTLVKCLEAIAELQGNVMRIESRPIRGVPWEYTMHIDVILPSKKIVEELSQKLEPLVIKNDVKGIYQPGVFPASS